MPRTKRHPPRCQLTPAQVDAHSGSMSENASQVSPQSEPVGHNSSMHISSNDQAEVDLGYNEEIEGDGLLPDTSKKRWNSEWLVEVIDEHGTKKQKSLSVRGLIALDDGEKVVTNWNDNNQPVENSAALLGGFMGHVASNFSNFPIIYKTWHKVPTDYKNNVYTNVIKALSEKNSANRKRLTTPHTLGSKTLARKKHELEIENGREYSRGEMYHISHKKKDGSFVNEEAQKKSEELEKEIEQGTSENEAYIKVFGKEHPGYVRGMGFGVCPSQMPGSSSRSGGCTTSDGPSRAEYDSLKLQLKVLQDQMNFFMSQYGGQIPSSFPANQVTDLGSPAEARRSSGASHEPHAQGPSSSSNP